MNQYKSLTKFLNQYKNDETIAAFAEQLKNIDLKNNTENNTQQLINLYHHSIPRIEQLMWQNDIKDEDVDAYQQLFHELEKHISSSHIPDNRHKFIIAIPVADRPQHLQSCLHSILTLCSKYNYGGLKNGLFKNIKILISDDSHHSNNINKNQEMAKTFTRKGLEVIYFGQDQQKDILSSLNREKTLNITGNIDFDKFYHKGASITRNITYLKLQQLQNNDEPTLFYFIDSDQEFQVSIESSGEHKECYALNYFYYLDKIFSTSKVSILTGKVVGDPPVSPSVMAGTFLEDLIVFLKRISELNPEQACKFHGNIKAHADDASYHDMADLFGFKATSNQHNYQCSIKAPHNHINCFSHFAGKLNQFFDGEHPTRKTYYQYENALTSTKPARTIYTGNYIFKPENLKYFIPFANLKLRMAGPVLGRIIKAELADHFVSANLPMLHNRTVTAMGQSEFRPGVSHKKNMVDLSGEFSRQFFGDVMLFSMIEITDMGYPQNTISPQTLSETITKIIISMQKKYNEKHIEISTKTNILKSLLNNSGKWWTNNPLLEQGISDFNDFINNIEFNFGINANIYKIINSPETINQYHKQISNAIMSYHEDMTLWQEILLTNHKKI